MTTAMLAKRLDRIDEGGRGPIRLIFQHYDETEKEAIVRSGLDTALLGLTIMIMKWRPIQDNEKGVREIGPKLQVVQ